MQHLLNVWNALALGRCDDDFKIVIAEQALQNQLMNDKRLCDGQRPLLYSVSRNVWAMQTQQGQPRLWAMVIDGILEK